MPDESCPCGRPLHYADPDIQALVERMVTTQGADEAITVMTVPERTWMVPRHYLALHGLSADDLPRLAAELGFREVTQTHG